MGFWKFFKDHLTHVFSFFLGLIFLNTVIWIDSSLKASIHGLLYLDLLAVVFLFFFLLVVYWSRKGFYQELKYRTKHPEKGFEERLDLASTNTNRLYEESYNALLEYSRLTNNELVEKLSKQQEFMSSWIHEIKVPIAALRLLSEVISAQIPHDKEVQITDEIHKIDSLVEQILYFSRLDNFANDYLVAKYSLKEIVKEVALDNMNYLLNKEIQFTLNGEDEIILTDDKWLQFIINQLMSNAIKYTKQAGKIDVTISTTNKSVLLSITDSGIGIPPEDLPRVFEQGFTGKNGRLQNTKSTGLGLYLAKNLTYKLGHELKIKSEIGKGTTVTIVFPYLSFYNSADINSESEHLSI